MTYNLSTPTCQKCFKSAPCRHCDNIRVAHSAVRQVCPDPYKGYLASTYEPVEHWLELHKCQPRTTFGLLKPQ